MKKLTFEQMAFSRASDAWCPISGHPVGPNVPRVQADRILASVGSVPIYHRFADTQGFVRYSNEIGCYDRVSERTHVYTDELDALELRLAGVGPFARIVCGDGLSQDGRPLELLTYMNDAPEYFLVDTIIHGNEPDGILGTLKAFEILMTHPDFAPLRGQYNIVFMPCCNPDGYYLGQRNIDLLGPHPSGVDTGINLNRVWPWYWDEFVPTVGESKGDAPITCCLEATAMEAWRYNGGAPRAIAWALDQHSTAGDGARYVSRDRCFRNLGEDDLEKLWADWTIFRLLRAVQARRVHEGPNPDLWTNYFRSRWRPHWHSYLSTLSQTDNGGSPCCSFVGEHNKVPDQVITSDRETYKSASDYNFDHIIALALVAQGGLTERKAAVLIEHEVGANQVLNSEFHEWSELEDGYRPRYWNRSRAILAASTKTEKHMVSKGRPVRAAIDVTMEIPAPDYCDDTGGSDVVFVHGVTSDVVLAARAQDETPPGPLAVFSCDLASDPVKLFEGAAGSATHKQWRLGKALPDSAIYLVGLGDHDLPWSAAFVKYTLSGTWSTSTLVTHTDALEDAGACLDHANGNLYIFGGTGAAADSQKVFKADCTAETFTEVGTNLLGSGDHGMGSCFCSGGDLAGMIVVVGGIADGESGLKVRVFDTSDGSLDSYDVAAGEFADTEPGKAPSIMHCAVVYDGTDTVWFYGGDHPSSGDVYHSTWSITWNGASFDAIENHVLQAGLSDDGDPEDYAGDEEWIRPFRYWRGVRTYDSTLGNYVHLLFGGLERLPDGTDESDVANMRGFYAHYVANAEMGRPADYNYGYLNYNSHLDITGWDKANMSWSMRAEAVAPGTQSAMYARLNLAPGDSAAGVITTRRVRTYYMHPPQWWWREHAAINIAMARPDYTEDELRLYARGYRQAQGLLLDAPMVQTNTLWPSSWSPAGMTRAVETATWADALDPRWFRLQLDWLPAASFVAMTTDTKLVTIGGDEGSHFELWAITSSSAQREYVRGTAVSAPEPVLRLWRVQGEDMDSIDVPCYWGGHIRDTALGRFDSPMQIEIWNHASIGSGLVVRNGWAEGWEIMASHMTPVTWIAPASVILHGGGWWAEPQMLEMDRPWKARYTKANFPQGALLIGDRDPTSGQVSARGTFRYSDTFTRGDDANLGSNWDVILQTGNGWNVSSNQARCEQLGWERWIAYPYLRDASVLAEVKAPSGGKVGLFTRLQWALAGLSLAHGYAGYLHCTGAATANLIIARYYRDGSGVQQVSVLTTEAVTYTASATVTLELAATGSTITLTMSGAHTGVATAVDTNHILPGAFGLFGETPGAGQYVWADNIRATVPTTTKLRITE